MFYKILTVAALATFEVYAAIPAGFAFKLNPWVIFAASTIGGLVGLALVYFLGEKISAFIKKKWPPKKEKKLSPMAMKIWDKYGVIGLGFLGTITIGAPISMAVGVAMGADLKRLLFWCCLGVITRCLVFTFIVHHGLKLF